MALCALCEKPLSSLSQKRISDGYICKNCFDLLPKSMRNNITKYNSSNLTTILDYNKNLDISMFSPTASFGNLHIDEIHGLFAISEKLDNEGMPVDKTDIFHCLDLREVGLTPTNPVADKTGKVFCDVELHCWFNKPDLSFTIPIKKKVNCPSKRVDKSHLEWDYPGDLIMFMKMFNQMLQNAQDKYMKQYVEQFPDRHSVEIFKAQSLFMLADGYDIDILNSQRDRLMKAFHDIPECSKIIDDSYNLLLDTLV